MKSFTEAEAEAFHSGRQKNLTLTFSDGTIIENADILNESMSFTQSICTDTQLTFGRCSSASFKIQLLGVAQKYAGLTFTAKISAKDTDGVEHTRNIGTFKVISDKATSNRLGRELECYDKLYDILPTDYSEWYNALTFPMTLKAYRDAFFSHIGIPQESVELVNDSMTITKNFVAENYSGSEVLEDICEINGVFGILNADNKFQYITVEAPPEALFPAEDLYPSNDLYPLDATNFINHSLYRSDYYMASLKYEEFICEPITQIQIRMSENDIGAVVGVDGNTYIIQDNPLVYGKTTAELSVIGNRILSNIGAVTYVPMSVECNASLWYELGDSMRIQTDNDVINTIFLSVTLSGITALKQRWESTGQEYYTEKANSTERSIMVVKQKTNELERNVEETKSTITEVQQDLDDNVTTLQSQITQNATSITSEVTRATNSETSLSSRITQNANSITSEITNRQNADSALSSRISQTETDISLKVSKGDVSSQLSIESGQVTISSNRLVIDSDNFQLTRDGYITANGADIQGELKTGTSGYYLYLDGYTIQGKYYSSDTGSIQLSGGFSNLSGNTIFLQSSHIALDGNIHVRTNNEFGYDFNRGADCLAVTSYDEEYRYWSYVDIDTDKTYCIPTKIRSDGTVAEYQYNVTFNNYMANSIYSLNTHYVRKGIILD